MVRKVMLDESEHDDKANHVKKIRPFRNKTFYFFYYCITFFFIFASVNLTLKVAPDTYKGENMKNTMKAVLVGVMSFLLMSVALTGCQSELEKEVAKAQEDLPIAMGDGMSLTDFEIVNDDVVCTITYDERDIRIDSEEFELAMELVKDEIKRDFLAELNSDEDSKKMLEICKKENKGLSVNMRGTVSGMQIVLCRIDPKDM